MQKRYVYFSVFHPGKKKRVLVDIEVDSIKKTEEYDKYGENGRVLDEIIIPLLNIFKESAGLSANYMGTCLQYQHRQVEYLGDIHEIIHKICEEWYNNLTTNG